MATASDTGSQLAVTQASVRGHVSYLRSRKAQVDMLVHMAWAQSPLGSLDAQLSFVNELVEALRAGSLSSTILAGLGLGSQTAAVERAATELGAARQLVLARSQVRKVGRPERPAVDGAGEHHIAALRVVVQVLVILLVRPVPLLFLHLVVVHAPRAQSRSTHRAARRALPPAFCGG